MSGYKTGDLVLKSEPYVHVLSNEFQGKFCEFCLKEKENGKEDFKCCSKCSFVSYCNRTCQSNAWAVHRHECKFIKIARDKGKKPSTSLRFISLIIFKIKKYGEEVPYEEVQGRRISFSTLESHVTEIRKDLKKMQIATALACTLREYLGPANLPSASKYLEVFGKMSINSYTIYSEVRAVGSGLYLGGSIFNHSCDCDANFTFHRTQFQVHTIRDLPHRDAGKVCINYIDSVKLTAERQKLLRETYYFNCKCNWCLTFKHDDAKTKLLEDTEEAKKKELECKKKLEEFKNMLKKAITTEDLLAVKKFMFELLQLQTKSMAYTHECVVNTCRLGFDLCIDLELYEDALEVGHVLYHSYRHYYADYNKGLAMLVLKMGKMSQLLQDSETALSYLIEAEKMVEVCYGEGHELLDITREILREAEFCTKFPELHISHSESYP